jgi:hypothetical protein
VSFNEADKMGYETVKERLDERRQRVMELWGRGLAKVEEDKLAKKVMLKYKGHGRTTTRVEEREVSPENADAMV